MATFMRHAPSIQEAVGQKLLLAFGGQEAPPAELTDALHQLRPGGITLYHSLNLDHPGQVRQLVVRLQQEARKAHLPPLLIAADQEGGQLMAVGTGTTPLPGNMALGAAGSPELARQAGEVLGRELAAMGINVNYAPCCDVNVNPDNPVIGIRSFGEDPLKVAELSAAVVAGIQSAGVAATAKHFPGHGDTDTDSHYGLPVVPHSLQRLRRVELPPFAAAIRAGVKLVMSGHLALPAVDGNTGLPATLSPAVLKGLLRTDMRFHGVIVTDAMEMQAIRQGDGLGEDAVRAAAAGADLLLLNSNPIDQRRVFASLLQAVQGGRLEENDLLDSAGRVLELKEWLATQGPPPDLSVVGCSAHQAVAAEIAVRSITLVRDQAGWLPLRLRDGQRLAVVFPRPMNLTPADTSATVVPALSPALRMFCPNVDELMVAHSPDEQEIADVLRRLRGYAVVVLGTLNAFSQTGQAALVRAVLAARNGAPTIVAALRMPYDLAAFPEAPAFVCSFGILEPSMQALAQALAGQTAFQGRLPVSIPGLYPAGHGHKL